MDSLSTGSHNHEDSTAGPPVKAGNATESMTSISHSPSKIPSRFPSSTPSLQPSYSSIEQPSSQPTLQLHMNATTASPTASLTSFVPGNLTKIEAGLYLSRGLSARLIASAGSTVNYSNGSSSEILFHGKPDAGSCFGDPNPNNPGGWIYVSNSEMNETGFGGVGAITFDANGGILGYRMVMENTTMNCGGGSTPWGTWVSCEEIEFDGLIFQVDPTGEREAQVLTMGLPGGRWESFAYDVRDKTRPHFFATEDLSKGCLRRFTPDAVDWNDPWTMLHGTGTVDFLVITPNSTNNGGTFFWSNDTEFARNNARSFYPDTEGIDTNANELFLICKNMRMLFVLNLDDGSYYNSTTLHGLFDGKPDQVVRLQAGQTDVTYFTEGGGKYSGVHARDALGRFYTLFESPIYSRGTSGLGKYGQVFHCFGSYHVLCSR